ncbi:hypothetical protein ACWA2C_16150 [Priestia megaterium]
MENVQWWQITEFADKLAAVMQEQYQDEKAGVHYNTLDKWFKTLETKKIHYITRAAGEKVYDELDLKIACFIYVKRQEKWSLDAIHNLLEESGDTRPFPQEYEDKSDSSLAVNEEQLVNRIVEKVEVKAIKMIEDRIETKFEQMQQELHSAIREVAASEVKGMLPKPEPKEEKPAVSEEDEQVKRMREATLKMKVELELENEALEEWYKLPQEERMRKAGFFRKEEDTTKRDKFVREYRQKHFEEFIKKAYTSS